MSCYKLNISVTAPKLSTGFIFQSFHQKKKKKKKQQQKKTPKQKQNKKQKTADVSNNAQTRVDGSDWFIASSVCDTGIEWWCFRNGFMNSPAVGKVVMSLRDENAGEECPTTHLGLRSQHQKHIMNKK